MSEGHAGCWCRCWCWWTLLEVNGAVLDREVNFKKSLICFALNVVFERESS